MAQGIMEDKVRKAGLTAHVDSAGTASYHVGEPPDHRAISKTNQRDIDISHYRGRQFDVRDFDDFDLIFAMDDYNLRDILELAHSEEDRKKVDLILNKVYPGSNMSVPDPYYGGDSGFENVFNLLDQACEKILEDVLYE